MEVGKKIQDGTLPTTSAVDNCQFRLHRINPAHRSHCVHRQRNHHAHFHHELKNVGHQHTP